MMKRVYNERGPSYPKLEVHEPRNADFSLIFRSKMQK